MIKVALLSHRGGNIGHDFMAVGMEVALRDAFGDELCIDHFEQHNQFDVYPRNHWLRYMHKATEGRLNFLRHHFNTPSFRDRNWPQTLPLTYNLAVASGGPNIVRDGHRSADLGLMLHHLNGAFHYRGVPLVDAGVGACFPLEKISEGLIDSADSVFYKTAFEFATHITVRDVVAKKVVSDLGFKADLIPCGAIGCGRVFSKLIPEGGETNKYVAINFQQLGANTDWGQDVDPAKWMCTIQAVIADLERRHPVILLAHNAYELKIASQLAPHLICVLPTTVTEYGKLIRATKAAVVSRIHAAVPLAGIGVPSITIGTDTRIGTVDQLGLPSRYVKLASSEWIIDQIELLIKNADDERQRLIHLRETTVTKYAALFQEHAIPT